MNIFLMIVGGLVVIFLGLIVFSYFRMKNLPEVKPSKNIRILNAKNFKMQTSRGIVLVDFWAAWCAPCKMLAPVLNEIAEKDNRFTIAKLNVEQYQQIAAKQKIKNLPTLVLYKNGKEVTRIMGFKNKKVLMKEIEPFL